MATKIFLNLPVKNLQATIDFFTQLGFAFNPQFTDEKAACMIIADNSIYAMFITHEFFSTFTKKPISDATKTTEVLICIDAESKEAVQSLVKKAVEAGGNTYMDAQDHGWMYQHSFADLDGHQWEVAYMDISQFPSN